ncbi:hypothetical protein F7725_018660 [Dissostichus mawsoni]|uniref:Uncharacterized protein n=1 Tax=Dissostichus mawsoni TaxID=36200 RepID=A0A7J5XSZ3_DISMA|nr:hypothetical protein F7725_018660 [Dissostichus mawsoni]
MNTCAFLLILTVQIYADGIEGPTAAGCTFEEDSDPSLCDFTQGEEDDFDWLLFRTYSSPYASPDLLREMSTCMKMLTDGRSDKLLHYLHNNGKLKITAAFLLLLPGSYMLVNSSQHAVGHRAQLMLQTLSENDTHCVQFSYFLYSRDGHSPGGLRASVWNTSGSHAKQWHQVELAVSTFWPNEYQVLIEATVSRERRGYIAIDDIMVLNYPCYKAPHFSRLGDEEVNAGQNATFQCVASGRAAEAEKLLLELDRVQRTDQDLYRCVTQSPRGSGVSNFAELVVKVPPSPIAPPQLLRAGSTYLIIQLNTNSILGDGPIIRKEIEYRASQSPWSEVHGVNMVTYKLWHLEPDTEYHISVLLTRPGEGGTGPPGPPLVSRTKCAEPMRALRGLTAADVQSRQLSLQWENLAFNLTRCHTYSVSLCYRYTTAGGGGGHNTTVRECLAVEHNASRFTLRDLPPYHGIHVRLSLANPEGKKEGREVTFQTEEDSKSLKEVTEKIVRKHRTGKQKMENISYQSIESSDPGINVPGPRRTVSKLKNETYHMFSNLHPEPLTSFQFEPAQSRALGKPPSLKSPPTSQLPRLTTETCRPPERDREHHNCPAAPSPRQRGPCQVVVEEEMVKKVKRELGLQECFPLPMSHGEAQARGTPHYYTAELPPSSIPEASPFTVGDNHTYNGYWNSPLDPRKSYLVYFQAMSNFRGESRKTASASLAKQPARITAKLWRCPSTRRDGSDSRVCAGGLVVLILLLGAVIIIIKKGKPANMNKTPITYRQEKSHMGSMERSFTDQSTLQEDERMALSFMDAHTCGTRSDVRSSVNEASSLLGGSPRHQCGRKGSPYHTGPPPRRQSG